jgi:uncharacterized protein
MIFAIADTGPLYAAVDADDDHHASAVATLSRADLRFAVPALVVAETTYLVGKRFGMHAEADFLRSARVLDVEGPTPDDFERMAELVDQYADFPLGGTDASVVALAERLGASVIVTLDRRHFGAIRPRHCDAFELLP